MVTQASNCSSAASVWHEWRQQNFSRPKVKRLIFHMIFNPQPFFQAISKQEQAELTLDIGLPEQALAE
jgi:hypothetical protein